MYTAGKLYRLGGIELANRCVPGRYNLNELGTTMTECACVTTAKYVVDRRKKQQRAIVLFSS